MEPMTMLAVGSAAVSIGSSIASGFGGMSADKKAKETAKKQSQMTYAQRMEEIRRVKLDQESAVGMNRAAIGASNIQFSGSAKRALDETRSRFSQDIAWRNKSAREERESIRKGYASGSALGHGLRAATGVTQALVNFNK